MNLPSKISASAPLRIAAAAWALVALYVLYRINVEVGPLAFATVLTLVAAAAFAGRMCIPSGEDVETLTADLRARDAEIERLTAELDEERAVIAAIVDHAVTHDRPV